jgi:hypothetical protein
MPQRFGSQFWSTLEEARYELVDLCEKEALLLNLETGEQERWAVADDHAGYIVEIDDLGYEFVSEMPACAEGGPS